jgi:hypothetical protein
MPSEHNKGRAVELNNLLNGKHDVEEWCNIFAKILRFLLNRYTMGD